jgi:hypothetical protein
MTITDETTHHPFDHTYTQYQLNRSLLRKLIRYLYLLNIRRFCNGPSIDFGCGVGSLLQLLPKGSVGLEINESTVLHCQKLGLPVKHYDLTDNYQFKMFQPSEFTTLVSSHVMEHLQNPSEVIAQLFSTAERLKLHRLVFIVPGWKGYISDKTHKTFITKEYLVRAKLFPPRGWKVTACYYFPFICRFPEKYFTHNELTLVFSRK